MLKSEIRQQIRNLKRQFTPQQLEELSLPIIARLKPELSEAQVVMAYYSLHDEVCTHQLIDALVAEGKTVVLPRVVDAERMELRRYTGIQDLREGALHVMEPQGELYTDYARIDIVLVPGVAFDASGRRLGRGRGYYDRFFQQLSGVRLIGVCFDFQKLPEVPVDVFDVPVDMVI